MFGKSKSAPLPSPSDASDNSVLFIWPESDWRVCSHCKGEGWDTVVIGMEDPESDFDSIKVEVPTIVSQQFPVGTKVKISILKQE